MALRAATSAANPGSGAGARLGRLLAGAALRRCLLPPPPPLLHTSAAHQLPGGAGGAPLPAGAEAGAASGGEADSVGCSVAIAPGASFNVAAGRSAVRVEHVAGWSDVAELRGRPAGGGVWRASAAGPAAGGSPPQYDVAPSQGDRAGSGGGGGGGAPAGAAAGAAGLLRLAVPEKWISFRIATEGAPVWVSRLVEADLRVSTRGGELQLGTVRGLTVDLDTTTAAPTVAPTTAATIAAASTGGGVTGGEVSGTRVAIASGGPVRLRRLVGGTMQVTVEAAAEASGAVAAAVPGTAEAAASGAVAAVAPGAAAAAAESEAAASGAVAAVAPGAAAAAAESEAAAAASSRPAAVELGAVYGGRLLVRTSGGAVRIRTLDCGGHPTGPYDAAADGASSGGGGGGGGGGAGGPVSYGGDGGAEVLSYGGAVTVDGLEGDSVVDSGGGALKVLAQPGLRTAWLRSGGGSVGLSLDPGVALARLEVLGAGRLEVEPGLLESLELLPSGEEGGGPEAGGLGEGGAGGGVAADMAPPAVWRARVAAVAAAAGTGGGGRGGSQPAGGGRVVVVAAGGEVRLRRLGWMEALRARMAEREQEQARG